MYAIMKRTAICIALGFVAAACGSSASDPNASASNLDAVGALPVTELLARARAAAAVNPYPDSATVYQLDDGAPVSLGADGAAFDALGGINGSLPLHGVPNFVHLNSTEPGFNLTLKKVPEQIAVGSYACSAYGGVVTASTPAGAKYTNAATAAAPALDCTLVITALDVEPPLAATVIAGQRYINVGTLEASLRDASGGIHTLRVGFVDYGTPSP